MGRRKPCRTGLACTAMAATRGEVAWPTIADRLRLAGGVMSVREGHAVAANVGSAATELFESVIKIASIAHAWVGGGKKCLALVPQASFQGLGGSPVTRPGPEDSP